MIMNVKRLFDVFLVIITLPIWGSILVIFSLISLFFHGSPVFFTQDRGGKNGKVFKLYKLRTMTNQVDHNGILLPDENRVTPFGKFCRKCSIDELPSLLNVLKGDMSLVGPRPFLAEYLPTYTPLQARRHEIRPGITGWAQVNGRNALQWHEKFILDIWYVDHQSFILDLKILLMTFFKVFKQENISQSGYISAPKFDGEN